jgi:DNA repair protein RadC
MTWHAYEYQIKRKKLGETPEMTNSSHAAHFFTPLFKGLEFEKMYVAALDTKRHLFALEEVSSGGLSSANFFPRDVFRLACRANASAIVLAHNHPSGDPTPSPQDLEATVNAIAAGKLLGIKVIDHLIFGDAGQIYSIRANNKEIVFAKKALDKPE